MKNANTLLTEFIEFVKNKVDDAIKKEEIKKIELDQTYLKRKIDKPEYSMETGFSFQETRQYVTERRMIYPNNLDTALGNTLEFKSFVEQFKEIYKLEDIQFKLQSFLKILIQDYLSRQEVNPDLRELFVKELNGEPTRSNAIVRLKGITIEDSSIKLTKWHTLRRVTMADVEENIPIDMPSWNATNPFNQITAILEIEKDVLHASELQNEIEKAILILKLFSVSGVAYTSYKLSGKTITRFIGGTISSIESLITMPREPLKIFSKDTDRLTQFWKEFSDLNYNDLLPFRQTNNLENVQFAYKRYCDSLFLFGLFEQQMVSAIIGLESLYLNDSNGLSKMLRLRISKFLGLSGLDPKHIQDVLKDAYVVRSCFVHGNKINSKKEEKINRKYGEKNKLLRQILEYLRLSILISLAIQGQKDELIALIDDSFIDRTTENKLENQLKGIMKRFITEV